MATLFEQLGEGTYEALRAAVGEHTFEQCERPLRCTVHREAENRRLDGAKQARQAEARRTEKRRPNTVRRITEIRNGNGLAVLADELGTEAVTNYAFRR